MLVCTVLCQSVILVSHTTCLSFVNVYVGTCPPICHIHLYHYMSVSRSVTPCPAHVFLSYFFVSVCQYTCLSVTFIRTMSSICVCVSVFLRPYVRISCSQLCVNVSVCHIHVYYTSLSCISTTVCRSTCLCVCLSYFFVSVCQYTCISVTFVRTMSSICVGWCGESFEMIVSCDGEEG